MLDVNVPTSGADLDHVRGLMRAIIAWHRDRHQQDLALIDSYFDAAAFEEELATLPGKYAPPHGQLFFATVEGAPAGYRTMLLDTSIRQAEAQALYRRLGFRDVAPYYDLSAALRDWLVFMERPLSTAHTS